MRTDIWSKRIGAASLATTLLFTGNAWAGGRTAEAEETVAVAETTAAATAATEAATVPTESRLSRWEQRCAAIAEIADGRHIFVYDGSAGEMVFCNREVTDRLFPASITKVYAALVALMYLQPEEIVTAGAELALAPSDSSRAYINRGSRLTVEMLVEAMLLPSGSDASYVLAAASGRAIAGDTELEAKEAVEVFLQEMNRQGERLGFQNSHFVNPDGYQNEEHYMCPGDVALVAALAMKNEIIAKYMALQQDSVVFESGEHITWYNNNQLITPSSPYFLPSAVGMKTGYTGEAGHCLLAAFQEGDRNIIVGIFGSQERYPRYGTAIDLFEACK